MLNRYAYTYDPAGNRTSEQIDDHVVGASYDELDRLVSQQPSGPLVFAGTVNEPATVTIQGKPATVTSANTFTASVPVSSGTSTVPVTATDASGNTATRQYEVDSSGTSQTFTFDANGNLTSDGTRTFEWDTRNQLVAVNVGTHRSEFRYDGKQRRVRIVEKQSGAIQSDTQVLWCDNVICEERTADGITVMRRTSGLGEQVSGPPRYFTMDISRASARSPILRRDS